MRELSKLTMIVPDSIVSKYHPFEERVIETLHQINEYYGDEIHDYKEALLYMIVVNEDISSLKKLLSNSKIIPEKSSLYWYGIIMKDFKDVDNASAILCLMANQTKLVEVGFRDLFDAYPDPENHVGYSREELSKMIIEITKIYKATWETYILPMKREITPENKSKTLKKWYKNTMDAFEKYNKGEVYTEELKEFIKNYFEKY